MDLTALAVKPKIVETNNFLFEGGRSTYITPHNIFLKPKTKYKIY